MTSRPSVSVSSTTKPQTLIRRPARSKPHPRTRLENVTEPTANEGVVSAATADLPDSLGALTTDDSPGPPDDLLRIRSLLLPNSIPGVRDWGIPPEPEGLCDPVIEEKLAQFHALKRDPSHPKHFNDSLMSNRSFRNPHLYTKLVEFVDVDERTTNFPKDIWDPSNVRQEWFADQIAGEQKARSEQQDSAQARGTGNRARIDFTSSKPHAPPTNRHSGTSSKRNRFQPYDNGPSGKPHGSSVWG